jgi:hypothetical protein
LAILRASPSRRARIEADRGERLTLEKSARAVSRIEVNAPFDWILQLPEASPAFHS